MILNLKGFGGTSPVEVQGTASSGDPGLRGFGAAIPVKTQGRNAGRELRGFGGSQLP